MSARVVTVPDNLWLTLQHTLTVAGMQCKRVPAAPGQSTRYVLGWPDIAVEDELALSDREVQVLRGIAAGMSNATIGRSLHLSEDTIKTHCRRLFKKIGAHDRAHAVAIGFHRGILRRAS
jgi:ATP/maltotriose-dependent transcriptional regulator MalT